MMRFNTIAEDIELRELVQTILEDLDDPFFSDSYKRFRWGWILPNGKHLDATGQHYCVPVIKDFGDEHFLDDEYKPDNATAVRHCEDLTLTGLRKGWMLYIDKLDSPSFTAKWAKRFQQPAAIQTLYSLIHGTSGSEIYLLNQQQYRSKQEALTWLWNFIKDSRQSLTNSLTEGAKVTSALINRVLNDQRFTMGFEAEFVLHGVREYLMGDILENAKTTKNGAYVKPTAALTYSDLMRFWGPLNRKSHEVEHSNEMALRLRMLDLYEEKVGDIEYANFSAMDGRALFESVKNHFGLAGVLSEIHAMPARGFYASKEVNDRLREGLRRGAVDAAELFQTQYRLFGIDDTGEAYALTTDHVEDPADVSLFSLGDDEESVDLFLADVAGDISKKISAQVGVSTSPENNALVSKKYTQWIITVDDSVSHDGFETAGLELISPAAQGLQTGFSDLHRGLSVIQKFPSRHDGVTAETDKSTGLHINLGLTGFDASKFDFIKVIFLLGEEHLLNQFGRSNNQHARSIIQKLKNAFSVASVHANMNPHSDELGVLSRDEIELALGFQKSDMARIHEALISIIMTKQHGGKKEFDKYMSVNFKKLLSSGFIEFRIAGNSGYENRFDEIKNMIYRYATVMIAGTSDLYQNEYMKKLYKFISGITDMSTSIQNDPDLAKRIGNHIRTIETNPFAKYIESAGGVGANHLKDIRQYINQFLQKSPRFDPAVLKDSISKLSDVINAVFAKTAPDPMMKLKWAGLKGALNALIKEVSPRSANAIS